MGKDGRIFLGKLDLASRDLGIGAVLESLTEFPLHDEQMSSPEN